MKYQLWLFNTIEQLKADTPFKKIDYGNAPDTFGINDVVEDVTYKKIRNSFIRNKVKSKIVVNYLLNLNINENTTHNQRPKRFQ